MSWTPEDEKRLAEIWWHCELGPPDCEVCFLLAKLDEEKRARTAAQSVATDAIARLGEADVALAESERVRTELTAAWGKENARAVTAEVALAEERAKREAAETQRDDAHVHAYEDQDEASSIAAALTKRAETAEARVAELKKLLREIPHKIRELARK